jgi:hypothetical protein
MAAGGLSGPSRSAAPGHRGRRRGRARRSDVPDAVAGLPRRRFGFLSLSRPASLASSRDGAYAGAFDSLGNGRVPSVTAHPTAAGA